MPPRGVRAGCLTTRKPHCETWDLGAGVQQEVKSLKLSPALQDTHWWPQICLADSSGSEKGGDLQNLSTQDLG